MLELNKQLQYAVTAAKKATAEIMAVYSKDFGVDYKDDNSPLTEADKRANEVIKSTLHESKLHLLSEEGSVVGFEERQQWEAFWLVDPLDGTKEFIKRNGEFTSNIALVENNQVVLGVVAIPAKNLLYWAIKGKGAFRQNADKTIERIHVSNRQDPLRIAVSRSHLNDETREYIEKLNSPTFLIESGSSLKILLVAEGAADIYPRLAPTMEWDIAAAQIIVEEAGGKLINPDNNQPLSYNKEDLHNPHFIVSN